VWCWGSNIEGQIGNGSVAASEQPVLRPTRVAGIDNARSIHLGSKTSCARTSDGALYCWGLNQQKQIDDSSTKQITKPTRIADATGADLVAVGNYHICWTIGGRVTCRGTLAPLAADIASLTNVTALTAGYQHSCAIHDGGKVSCWGGDYLGVLGQGNQCPDRSGECTSKLRPPAVVPGLDANPVELKGNTYHSCVRYATGGVTCWGNNQGGRFTDKLPMEPWNKAHVLAGVVADQLYVGGIHTCTIRQDATSCIGKDYLTFVPRR
jgi:alpha-tubulin suppressor-like RCC1 family protein